MAQYDIHRNTGRNRDSTPCLVDIQSNEFRGTSVRVVIPLLRATGYPSYAPVLVVDDVRLVADPLLITSLPQDKLGAILRAMDGDEAAAVMNALDRVISSAYD